MLPATRPLQIINAAGFFSRLRGLMGYAGMPQNADGLLLQPCNSIHCFFMRFSIDAVFMDADDRIVRTHTCHPWSIGPWVRTACKVLELRAGEAQRQGFKIGDRPRYKIIA
jgi:uncharacterized membrane protein (UPF0127 family)